MLTREDGCETMLDVRELCDRISEKDDGLKKEREGGEREREVIKVSDGLKARSLDLKRDRASEFKQDRRRGTPYVWRARWTCREKIEGMGAGRLKGKTDEKAISAF